MLSKFFLTINKTFDKLFENFVKKIFTLNKKKFGLWYNSIQLNPSQVFQINI